MINTPKREREPELKETLMALENLSNRFDGLTLDLRTKVQAIYSQPSPEPNPLVHKPVAPTHPTPFDMVSSINEQVERLREYANRVEVLLMQLNRIV